MKQRLLADIPYFVEIAKHKSFSKASEVLDVSISTLSRRISSLEQEMGVQLFTRTTRNVELTEAGDRLFKGGQYLMTELDLISENVLAEQFGHTGSIRVSLSAEVYYMYLRGVFTAFAKQHPGIKMHIKFGSQWEDIMKTPVDIAIRAGELPDSELIMRKIGSITPALYASPKLLEKYPTPKEPKDLLDIPFITTSASEGHEYAAKIFKDSRQDYVNITNSIHEVNSLGLSMDFVLAGLGASGMVPHIAQPLVDKGELVRLLPDWEIQSFDVNAVMPPGKRPKRVSLFVDFLAKYFKERNIESGA